MRLIIIKDKIKTTTHKSDIKLIRMFSEKRKYDKATYIELAPTVNNRNDIPLAGINKTTASSVLNKYTTINRLKFLLEHTINTSK